MEKVLLCARKCGAGHIRNPFSTRDQDQGPRPAPLFSEKQAGKWLARWTKQSTMRVYREANSIVCISEKVREQLPDELRERTRVIYNGVDHNLFKAVPESLSRLRILSVGNLIAIKDHALLL